MLNLRKILLYSGCLYELLKGVVILAAILIIVNYFFASFLIVKGASMEPNYNDSDLIIVDKTRYTFGIPQRGDVVGLKFPGLPKKMKFIKRIIGLPGEHIVVNNEGVFIGDKKLEEDYISADLYRYQYETIDMIISENEYFVMGDNRTVSSDSRSWGSVPKGHIIGRAYIRIWPFKEFGFVEHIAPLEIKALKNMIKNKIDN